MIEKVWMRIHHYPQITHGIVVINVKGDFPVHVSGLYLICDEAIAAQSPGDQTFKATKIAWNDDDVVILFLWMCWKWLDKATIGFLQVAGFRSMNSQE